ncbi:hypothetical protein Tco_0089289 [Tanacetum coccineum]
MKVKNSDVVGTFDHKSLESQNVQLKETVTALQERIKNYKAENEKVRRHYQELFDSIKVTRIQTIEKINSLQNEIENLKIQLKGKMPCVTSDVATPKVSACDKYAIDVEPIPPRIRNNREAHLDYLKHLKESVETLREIVEEAKVERPLDRSLASACLYTKDSHELLEYVIGTCLKDLNKRDTEHPYTPLTRKKQVTFEDQCETSNNNTHKHVKQLNETKTNVPVIPSTGVNNVTKVSGSQPRSNTKNDKTLPANSVHKKKVEAHLRNNKLRKYHNTKSSHPMYIVGNFVLLKRNANEWQGPYIINEVHKEELYIIVDTTDHSLVQTMKGTSFRTDIKEMNKNKGQSGQNQAWE